MGMKWRLVGTTGWSKKVPAKFSDTCSIRADGLYIGCPKLVGSRKAANSNMQKFSCYALYLLFTTGHTPRSLSDTSFTCVGHAGRIEAGNLSPNLDPRPWGCHELSAKKLFSPHGRG